MQTSCDLVIIGAGAAGLAAADAAGKAGLNVELLEAMDRIGGRAFTDTVSLPAPFDHGCQWLHSAGINPFREEADKRGFRYWTDPFQIRIHDGNGWLGDDANEQYAAFSEATSDKIDAAALAGDDEAAAAFIDRNNPWAQLFARNYAGILAVAPERSATYDSGRYTDTDEDWPVENGYGALIAATYAHVPVHLNCPVQSIDWSGAKIVVGTANGMILCRAVLVTVSIPVLKAGRLKFSPQLPGWKCHALDRIEMGYAEKVGFWLKRDPCPDIGMHYAMLNGPEAPDAAFLVKPYGRPMITFFAGADYARDQFAQGEEVAIAAARKLLGDTFGADIAGDIVTAKATQWVANPWVGGGYSSLKPGGGEARADLAKPIDNRLFFAGEATSPDAFTTAHGARQSGIDAVNTILAVLAK